eukprot:6192578-Amphidinium_carterae.1
MLTAPQDKPLKSAYEDDCLTCTCSAIDCSVGVLEEAENDYTGLTMGLLASQARDVVSATCA